MQYECVRESIEFKIDLNVVILILLKMNIIFIVVSIIYFKNGFLIGQIYLNVLIYYLVKMKLLLSVWQNIYTMLLKDDIV